MHHILKNMIQQATASQGLALAPKTPDTDAIQTMSYLWPVDTGHSLMRIGDDHDGGYLVPDDVDGIAACFSPGIGSTCSFERGLARRIGAPTHFCDRGKTSTLANYPDDFEFSVDERWLTSSWERGSAEFNTLSEWVQSHGPETGDLLLEMDIEGAEYSVLLSTEEQLLNRFRIIVLELHDLQSVTSRFSRANVFTPFFNHLSRNFDIVHAHPNNCCGDFKIGDTNIPNAIEVTLHRKDRRMVDPSPVKQLPHSLDRPNISTIDELRLDPKLKLPRPLILSE